MERVKIKKDRKYILTYTLDEKVVIVRTIVCNGFDAGFNVNDSHVKFFNTYNIGTNDFILVLHKDVVRSIEGFDLEEDYESEYSIEAKNVGNEKDEG